MSFSCGIWENVCIILLVILDRFMLRYFKEAIFFVSFFYVDVVIFLYLEIDKLIINGNVFVIFDIRKFEMFL